MIRASIIGATGYTGAELIHWLLRHPKAEIRHGTSESSPGVPIGVIHPSLAVKKNLNLITEKCDAAKIAKDSDVVFLCLPHGKSAEVAKQFLERGVKVVDLSADFRLKSAGLYQQWYGAKHPASSLLSQAVYGLPELHREKIKTAKLIANPGCYATATILSAFPLAQKKLVVPGSFIADAKSGVSGAGKKLESRYLFCEVEQNFLAYGVEGHRHIPEIEQELQYQVTFIPHLLPIHRGILVTLYATLKNKMKPEALWELFSEFYQKEKFITLLPLGQFPEIRAVQNSNHAAIGVHVEERNSRAIVVTAIDNLGKGASSQAVQNMNLLFGLDESLGL